MSIPDYISPIIGYRVWKWENTRLKSLCGERWYAGQSLAARCRASTVVGTIVGRAEAVHDAHEAPQTDCTCGVYASKSLEQLRTTGYERYGICGEVYLWGKVVEHERGWRAQLAYPKNLFLPLPLGPCRLDEVESRLGTLATYGCDIHVLGEEGNVPRWIRGSGYDASGFDLLVQRCKSWYARRCQERRIKRGDRVAILGRGIAVVEHVDSRWIQAVVWNKCELRIARKEIVWDERNMRWETDANAPFECLVRPMQ